MIRNTFSILLLISILVLSSCSKHAGGLTGPAAILTTGKWHTDSAVNVLTLGPTSVTITELISSLPACKADNYSVFNSDGTAALDEGDTKCNAGDPQIMPAGNWKLLENNTKIQLANLATGDVVTGRIVTLNDNLLKFVYFSGGGAVTDTTTCYLRHIK